MKISSTNPASQAKVYAQFRAAQEDAALARARRAAESAIVAESHIGSRVSLKLTPVLAQSQEVSGPVVHETRETAVSPGSVAVLDTASGKLVYQAPPPWGLI